MRWDKSVLTTYKPVLDFQGSKPWKYYTGKENMEREDTQMLVRKWWDIYNDKSLDYINSSANGQPLRAALLEAGVIHYIAAPLAA